MAPKTTPTSTANSGIRKMSNGESIIPSSTRADGSVRKEIRVKPGYKPPEDVEVYKNRSAEAWKNRGKGGVPGAQVVGADDSEPPNKAAAKNAKRREARKKAAASAIEDKDEDGAKVEQMVGNGGDANANGSTEAVNPEAEKAKEARKLSKKLRQARELQEKKEKGDSLLPEQFAKVIKINELIRQLDSLGFDADGEKKGLEKDKDAEG